MSMMSTRDLNYSSKFIVSVVAALKKESKHVSEKNRANIQPFSEYVSIRMQIVPIL